MAQTSGLLTSYTQTVEIKRTVTDRIIMTDPMNIVMINALGLDNESKFQFTNAPGVKYEWLSDTHALMADSVNTAALTSDSTLTQFTVTDGTVFQAGDVILINAEYMWVVSVSANILTVTRAFGGTQATHATAQTVTVVSRARVEGDDADNSPSTLVTSQTNYSQIFQKTVKVSRTDARIQRYGVPNIVEREIDKGMDELMMLLAKLPYHGQRSTGSTTAPSSAGGIGVYVTTNVTTISSVALTIKDVEDTIALCWNGGGNPRLMFCGAWAKRKLADFYAPYVRTVISETRGGITIDRIVSPLGIEMDVVVDRYCPTTKIYMVDPDYCGYITFDPFFYEDLGKTGDTAVGGYGEIIGEYGFVCAKPNAHGIITGFSVTA